MNYYPFHIGDYSSHTRHLTLMGDLAYRRLLDIYYLTERPLPVDAAECARLIGMRDHIQDVSEVLSDFFLMSDAGWTNPRADREMVAYHAKADRARAANKSRWDAGKNLKSDVKSDAVRIPTKNQEPITKNQEKPKTNTTRQVALSCPPNVDAQVWADFLHHRRAKKAEVTETALRGIEREAQAAGITLQAALEVCCQRGWTGFKAEWLRERATGGQQVSRQQALEDRNAEAVRRAKERIFGKASPMTIEGEVL